MKLEITKKHKYALQTIFATGIMYYFSQSLQERGLLAVILLTVYILLSSYFVHKPNSTFTNILITSILPLGLVVGVVLSLIFFPNLSLIFRLFSLAGFSVLFYIVALVNNVFLVVENRGETIPLYRVALTWSKILMVVIAIPLLAGVFKSAFMPLLETALTGGVTLVFYLYLIWVLKYDQETKKYKLTEIVSMLAFSVFLVVTSNLSVSFFPTETFLRALFVASIMIFGISYTEAHLKNIIKKRLITEHLLISVLFFVLLIIFKP